MLARMTSFGIPPAESKEKHRESGSDKPNIHVVTSNDGDNADDCDLLRRSMEYTAFMPPPEKRTSFGILRAESKEMHHGNGSDKRDIHVVTSNDGDDSDDCDDYPIAKTHESILTSFNKETKILTSFNKETKKTKPELSSNPTSSEAAPEPEIDIVKFFENPKYFDDPKKYKDSLDKPDEHGATILSKIFKPPVRFLSRRPLFSWILQTSDGLHLRGENLLSHALKCKHKPREKGETPKFPEGYPAIYFIKNFPSQAASLIQDETLQKNIIPHLRKCRELDGSTLQKLFPPCLETVSTVLDSNKDTLLHLASQYEPENGNDLEDQRRLVETIYNWCPSALEKMDSKGRSAFQSRIDSFKDKQATPDGASDGALLKVNDDAVTSFLKDKTIRLDDHELILRLLYDGQHERAIHFDLVEMQGRNNSVSAETLTRLAKNVKLENILKYVQIPCYPLVRGKKKATQPQKPTDNEPGEGRNDFKEVFDILESSKVKKVISLIVKDDEEKPHTDDVIKGLRHFDIEVFDWMKLDICSEVIRQAAPNVRKLFLYSSGNNAVLRSWSSADGLKQLKKLEELHITIYRRLESQKTTEAYSHQFEHRMRNCAPELNAERLKLDICVRKAHSGDENRRQAEESISTNEWAKNMRKFSQFIINLPDDVRPKEDIRVAIIDDGIDLMDSKRFDANVMDGRSFLTFQSETHIRTAPYYFSSTGHGTLMADLVLTLCPRAKLFVVRLDHGRSSTGVVQPTAESAVKAINWAIGKQVHIISMSWTVVQTPHNGHHLAQLRNAIKEAAKKKILMFGAASDQGFVSSKQPFPASAEGVFCIGAAKWSGHVENAAEKDAKYTFPGSFPGMSLPQTASGSSVATALASGLTALILYCVGISDFESCLADLQEHKNLRMIFDDLASDYHPYISAKIDFFFPPIYENCKWETVCRKQERSRDAHSPSHFNPPDFNETVRRLLQKVLNWKQEENLNVRPARDR